MKTLALALTLLATSVTAATAPPPAGGAGATPAPRKAESEPRLEDAEEELDAKESATRTLAALPEDRRLASLLAGLPDSRGGVIAAQELAGRHVVLVVSGRKSRHQARDWGAALGERMSGERAPLLLPIADLSTVPERMQKAVRKRLAREPRRVVLDWEGMVVRAHALEGDGPWLVAGSAGGKALAARALPPLTPEAVSAMLDLAREPPGEAR